MILKRLKINTNLGEPTNTYILADEESKECMVVDPAGESEKIIDIINILEVKLKYIYLTHCHGDHIGAVNEVKKSQGGKILIHRIESENLNNPEVNLVWYIGMKQIELEADSRLDDGDLIHVGNIELKVLHTPGHTNGSSCLYCEKEKFLISGDTIFRGTWGRTDLPTGSLVDIMNSITNKIINLPGGTIIYPGHGKSTLIKEELPIYTELKPRQE